MGLIIVSSLQRLDFTGNVCLGCFNTQIFRIRGVVGKLALVGLGRLNLGIDGLDLLLLGAQTVLNPFQLRPVLFLS